MGLLQEIRDAAVDAKTDLPTLLRKCRILASRLGHDGLKEWVQHELDGYPDDTPLPAYRGLDCQSHGTLVGIDRQFTDVPIPPFCIPEDFHKFVKRFEFRKGVAALVDLSERDAEGTRLTAPWPPDLVARVARQIYRDMTLLNAWRQVPRAAIVGILDIVQNRVLSFALEIEEADPDAGEAPPARPALSQEKVGAVFNTYIMGDVGNVAAGSTGVTQTSVVVTQGDLDGLLAYFEEQGLPPDDTAELKEAVETDGTPPATGGFGKRVTSWVGKMVSKAASGAWKVGVSIASTILEKALNKYYGISE